MKQRYIHIIALVMLMAIPLSGYAYKKVIVNTNGVLPTFDTIDHPEGAEGHSITNVTKVPGQVQIFSADSVLLYDSGPFIADTSGMTIKVRGNTSVHFNQLPYKVKLQQKADLLLRDDTVDHRDKNWLLLGAQLYTIVGFYMNELLGMPYTPKCELVELTFNDSLCGLYLLAESISRNTDCRINVLKDAGYIVERDAYWWNEPLYFTTNMFTGGLRWTFKYPDADIVTDRQIHYISSAINALEASLTNMSYTNHLDVLSFAQWLLGQDVLGIWDGWGSNLFLCKHDEDHTSKFFVPCLWDFDTMASSDYRNRWVWVHTHEEDSYFPWLLANKLDPTFLCTYCDLWEDISDRLLTFMNERMTPYANIFPSEYTDYTSWFEERKVFMDEQVQALRETASCATSVHDEKDFGNKTIKVSLDGHIYIVLPDNTKYNILGQRM